MGENEISKITEILNDLRERFARIEERLGNKIEDLERRVKDLEDDKRWMYRLLIANFLLPIILAVVLLVLKLG